MYCIVIKLEKYGARKEMLKNPVLLFAKSGMSYSLPAQE